MFSCFKVKKNMIFHILYIIVAPLCPAFLKCIDFYKAHCSEKHGVLWLASYPVCCDWLNTSSVWRKCYALYHIWKHTASPRRGGGSNSENKSYTFFLCANICGGVFEWGILEDGWVLLTDLIYAQTACNTPKRKETTKSRHMSYLNSEML